MLEEGQETNSIQSPVPLCQKSDTSGRAGGLICEPLKAVWPAYAGTHVGVAVMKFFTTPLLPLNIISHRAKAPRPQSVNFHLPPWRSLRSLREIDFSGA